MSPALRKRLNLAFAACWALLAVFIVAAWLHEPVAITTKALVSGGTPCPVDQLWEGAQVHARFRTLEREWRHRISVVRRDPAGYVLWNTPTGEVWLPSGGDWTVAALVAQQEAGIYNVGSRTIQPGDVVFDGGAHVGLFARAALRAGASKVVAIEPSAPNLECFRRNLATEIESGKVILVPKGVWNKKDQLPFFHIPSNSAGDSFVRSTGSGIEAAGVIELTTIDDIVRDLAIPKVNFIKLDIKGAAANAIKGGASVIRRDRPVVVVALEDGDEYWPVTNAIQSITSRHSVRCGECCGLTAGKAQPIVVAYQ